MVVNSPHRNLLTFMQEKAAKNEERPFIHFEGREITYRELDQITNRLGNGLKNLGVIKGDKVAIMLPNCLEFVFVWLGIAKIGAVEVPVNTAHKGDLLAYLLNNSDAEILVVDSRYLEVVGGLAGELTKLRRLVVWNEAAPTNIPETTGFEVVSFQALYSGLEMLEDTGLAGPDDFCVLYTSGTTGPSKGVVMSQRYVLKAAQDNANILNYSNRDVLYTCLPLFHGNAQLFSILSAMIADARVVLVRRFSVSKFWQDIREHGATAFNAPGSVLAMLLKQQPQPEDANNPVRVCFTAGVPAAVWKEFEERFRVKILEGYGSTECGMVLMNTLAESREGSIGKPVPGYQVTLLDNEDNEVPVGQVGEIAARSTEPFLMMKGYYKMPAKSWEACRNLWFHTGDYARRDADGFYYFVDRKKDVIRRRGENISSFEVERAVNGHPKVLESAALAIPSDLGEYEVKIVVVPRPDSKPTHIELYQFCQERMAYFMVPRYIEFREHLPKTPTDRVEKYKLRQEGLTANTWDAEG